jgi:hypothetical protein
VSKNCVICSREISNLFTLKNPEKKRAWKQQNPERRAALDAAWKAKNKEKMNAARAKWRETHPAMVRLQYQDRRHSARRATPQWASREKMAQLYADAIVLTEATGIPHEVDHIIPILHPLVCGLHCEANMQVLTRAENRCKSNKFEDESV